MAVMELETLSACPLCDAELIWTMDAVSNICECESCGYMFDNPRPTVKELIAFYSQPTKYDSWLSEERARDLLWKRRLRQLLRIRKPGSLLDVGAGIGQFLDLARPHFAKVCGTEVSDSAVVIAREKYGLDLLHGEVDRIDFGSTQFDNITLFHVLEHVPNPRSMVEKCARLLVKGGVLVIAVPNDVQSIKARVRKVLRAIGVRKYQKNGRLGLPRLILDGSLPEIHLSHFTLEALRGLIQQVGFSVVRDTLDPYYVAKGLSKWKERGYYGCCLILKSIVRVNLYDTILLVGGKSGN
jgi:ubiquinone/menaquinone biosynthesis C-methylase UbiE